LICDDGLVEAAGVFLRSVIAGSILPRGLGARHRSAAAITAATKATAITVSESTGNVAVFRDGKLIMEIEKPRAIGAMAPQVRDLFHRGDGVEEKELIPEASPKKDAEK